MRHAWYFVRRAKNICQLELLSDGATRDHRDRSLERGGCEWSIPRDGPMREHPVMVTSLESTALHFGSRASRQAPSPHGPIAPVKSALSKGQ